MNRNCGDGGSSSSGGGWCAGGGGSGRFDGRYCHRCDSSGGNNGFKGCGGGGGSERVRMRDGGVRRQHDRIGLWTPAHDFAEPAIIGIVSRGNFAPKKKY